MIFSSVKDWNRGPSFRMKTLYVYFFQLRLKEINDKQKQIKNKNSTETKPAEKKGIVRFLLQF
jgi:hypothetical protein